MLSSSPIDRPNQDSAKMDNTASKFTVRVLGRLSGCLTATHLATHEHKPSSKTQSIKDSLSVSSKILYARLNSRMGAEPLR